MLITDKDNKELFLMIELSQVLKQNQCTYKEAKEILSKLQYELKTQQENKEYNTVSDWAKGVKNQDYENQIIEGWDHIEMEVEI